MITNIRLKHILMKDNELKMMVIKNGLTNMALLKLLGLLIKC
jgi:hypothetical protein